MAISPYLARLRERVGHDLVLLASVAVLPRDAEGRILLVLNRDTGLWQTIGGAVEPDETPQDAARREALEEAGVEVELGALMGVFGGPEYRLTYPNGDQAAYISTVFEARVRSGMPHPDNVETAGVEWFTAHEIATLQFDDLNQALLRDLGSALAVTP